MSTPSFIRTTAIFFAVVFLVPSAFFVAPQKAHAQWTDIPAGLQRVITIVKETLNEMHTFTSMLSDIANDVNTFILQPLAFVLSGNLMKMLTSSVVSFVIGKANGTGIPQFVVDVRKSMQTVADSQALAYLKQVNLTGSPFSSSITSALRTNYLQGSSLAGMWAANMCTLSRSSPNVQAYLAGNWSQGGVAAWFALTTQTQNNPYMLYQTSQAGLASVIGTGVGGVTGARKLDLNWSSGFMSWCSANEVQGVNCPNGQLYDSDSGTCVATVLDGSPTDMPVGINPGDPCTKKDGTAGSIQTPGSVIKSTLDKVLGGQQDEIVRMGNIGPQITGILANVANVVNTVRFAQSLLGGGSMGGLLNAGQPGGQLSTFTPTQDSSGNFTSGYAGVTNSSISQSAAGTPSFSAFNNNMATRVNMYKTSWVTISTAATAAKNSVTSLKNTCTESAATATTMLAGANYNYKTILQAFIISSTAQATAAQTSLTATITPVLTQAIGASTIAAASLTMISKVEGELASGSSSYNTDLQTLLSMPPTSEDISNAQKNAQASNPNATTSTPPGSLNVDPYPSIVDQMNLIDTNAKALVGSCAIPSDPGMGF